MRLSKCKICGCKEFTDIRKLEGGGYKVICGFCGASTKTCDSEKEATTEWNEKICLANKEE